MDVKDGKTVRIDMCFGHAHMPTPVEVVRISVTRPSLYWRMMPILSGVVTILMFVAVSMVVTAAGSMAIAGGAERDGVLALEGQLGLLFGFVIVAARH